MQNIQVDKVIGDNEKRAFNCTKFLADPVRGSQVRAPLPGDKTTDGERPNGAFSSLGRSCVVPPTRGCLAGVLEVLPVKRQMKRNA